MTKDIGAYNTRIPPSAHALMCLRRIGEQGSDGMPRQEFNTTVVSKLAAFEYITIRAMPSHEIYKTHKLGQTVDFVFITEAGRQALINS